MHIIQHNYYNHNKFVIFVHMKTKEEKLAKIVEYIEYAGLTFTEPFSLISSTVVEASYWTGIAKSKILVYINKTFKERYGEKYIKEQRIAHSIASGKNPDEEKIMKSDVSKQLQPKEPKERKEYKFSKDKSEYKPKKATTILGQAFKEYTGLNTKENFNLYSACHQYYKHYKKFLWDNPEKWKKVCEKYGFVDKNLINEKEA